jgi:hypothetical protein
MQNILLEQWHWRDGDPGSFVEVGPCHRSAENAFAKGAGPNPGLQRIGVPVKPATLVGFPLCAGTVVLDNPVRSYQRMFVCAQAQVAHEKMGRQKCFMRLLAFRRARFQVARSSGRTPKEG